VGHERRLTHPAARSASPLIADISLHRGVRRKGPTGDIVWAKWNTRFYVSLHGRKETDLRNESLTRSNPFSPRAGFAAGIRTFVPIGTALIRVS
jgi:hypothetical protein